MFRKKEKLYISDLVKNPSITYPSYYSLSQSMLKNENLLSTIEALHSFNFKFFNTPKSYNEIFVSLSSGSFAIYKENYIVGYFGDKLMYLEPNGWKSMKVTKDVFNMDNWLIS